jgi:hypothetical protein
MCHLGKCGSRGILQDGSDQHTKADKLPILAVLRETQRFMLKDAFEAQTPAAIARSGSENCLFSWKIAK